MTTAEKLAEIAGFCPDVAVETAILKVAQYLGVERVDQDWENGETRFGFSDGSLLVFSGGFVEADDGGYRQGPKPWPTYGRS